ncbi:MAG: sigma-70 family RNA polymerase sigma factor [Bacteroidales bacterium]|jgi:RNA polymerase sigma-70 factor (ECF subfamily)|nr:sigma-70 family RNA polymerase sigma factor [Bacteroidales bacterium]
MDESGLVNGCKRGDMLARRRLYELYAEKMLALCLRYTNNDDVAHDLLHDGFIKIYSAIATFRWLGEGSLRAWMSRVFVNLCLAWLKKRDLLRAPASLEAVNMADDEEPEISEVPFAVLMGFVNELPPGYRAVFNLYVFEEWSHKEIAAKLNINEKSSSSQLLRARQLLSKKIKDYIKRHG